MIDTATPRKRELLKQKNLVNTPRSRKKLLFYEHTSSIMSSAMKGNSEVKRKIIRNLSFLKKYRLNRTFSTFLGVSDSYVNKYSGVEGIKQPRSDALCADHKRSVEEFFKRADISTNLPTAKRIKKDMKERRVLDRPMAEVYKEFQEQHPEIKASFLSFVRNKPSNVESTRKQLWYGCLCDSCTNIDLKLKALNKVAAKSGIDIKVKDKYEAASLTLCQKDGANHKLKCINRQCESCGCDNIVRFYQPLAEKLSRDLVSYSKWERVKKMYKGKEVYLIMPVPHRESITQLIINLSQELEKFGKHLYIWQQNQFSWTQKNVPKKWIILNMDFAENYSCISQQEVQSAHWSHNQVTIHPTVAYYRCEQEDCQEIVMEHLIFVSDDKTYDSAAVQEFVKLATKHLVEVRGLTIEKQVQLTDGCAAQYKSRIPFTDISFGFSDLGIPIERHFYGSRHGKGPSDGAGAVMKSVIKRAVMGGNVVINNAKDFYDYSKPNLTKTDQNHKEHFKRTIFHVENIEHNRPQRTEFSKTLKGTRELHAVQGVEEMKINTRNLSCFCIGCIGVNQDCKNKDYVDQWKLQELKKAKKRKPKRQNVSVSVQCTGRTRGQRGGNRGAVRGGRRNVEIRTGRGRRTGRTRTRNRRIEDDSSSESNTSFSDLQDTSSDDDNDSVDLDQAITTVQQDVPNERNAKAGTRGGARVRGGASARKGLRTRGGKTAACIPVADMSQSTHIVREVVEEMQDIAMPVELFFDGDTGHQFSYDDDVETFETMVISNILQFIDGSIPENSSIVVQYDEDPVQLNAESKSQEDGSIYETRQPQTKDDTIDQEKRDPTNPVPESTVVQYDEDPVQLNAESKSQEDGSTCETVQPQTKEDTIDQEKRDPPNPVPESTVVQFNEDPVQPNAESKSQEDGSIYETRQPQTKDDTIDQEKRDPPNLVPESTVFQYDEDPVQLNAESKSQEDGSTCETVQPQTKEDTIDQEKRDPPNPVPESTVVQFNEDPVQPNAESKSQEDGSIYETRQPQTKDDTIDQEKRDPPNLVWLRDQLTVMVCGSNFTDSAGKIGHLMKRCFMF